MPLSLSLLPLLSLLGVLLAVGAALCAGAVVLSARSLLRPPRMTDGKAVYLLRRLSPGDLGLQFEEVSFNVRDEKTGESLKIAAWWIPAASAAAGQSPAAHAAGGDAGRCVVILHGYADAKVGAIAWAPVWHDLGYHILVMDLRAHGESGGDLSTGGDLERHDVSQVLDQLRAERSAQTGQIVLFGVSLGAAVALAVAADAADAQQQETSPRANGNGDGDGDVASAPAEVARRPVSRSPIAAVVLESPFADFARAAAAQMARLGLPAGPRDLLHRAAIRLAERTAGADFAAVRPVGLLARVPAPVMAITPADDPHFAAGDAARFTAAMAARPAAFGPDAHWQPASGHLMAVAADPQEYRRRLAAFLEQASREPSEAANSTGGAPLRSADAARQVGS